jgi:hypothetical protein
LDYVWNNHFCLGGIEDTEFHLRAPSTGEQILPIRTRDSRALNSAWHAQATVFELRE